MYYIVYKITNKINNKIYIGVHKTENLNDGYMSSSEVVKYAIKKYGIKAFTKEIIYFANSEKEMFNKEAEIVNESFVKRKDTYNINCGGNGGWYHWHGTEGHRLASSKGGKISGNRVNNPLKNPEWQKQYDWTRDSTRLKEIGKKANTPEALFKKKETFKQIKHQQGENNSQYGTTWLYHPVYGNIKAKKEDIQIFLDKGYIKGRKIKPF
jgi:hypothetical protein